MNTEKFGAEFTDTFGGEKKRTVPQAVFDAFPKNLVRAAMRQAEEELARIPRNLLDAGNPNHPQYDLHLFGEHADTFMARQYK